MSNSNTRDVSHQSDLTKMKSEADGSFKRQDSSFRNFIERELSLNPRKIDTISMYLTLVLKGLKTSFAVHCALLWDKKAKTIVNNESSEIIRMFNTAFNHLLPKEYAEVDLYPDSLKSKIDELNEWIYPNINNGVYRAGFATSQEAHSTAVKQLFEALDKVEGILAGDKKYIVGDQLTECDVRLWVTAVRFDPAYVGHFKCNIRDIRNGYPNINRWMKNLYWNNAAFKDSTNFEHIKNGYYWAQTINPTRIVPVGPIPAIEPL
ncbi:glutathione S-transferase [Gymnopus androsaceus JB14]|uniref:Glutathione S-transferase n=1 Tax=Gymnopus androsaceus JB14 TaxID=1447944 RepID=A0A6A4HFE9_9AGAR|nr:glutathione S-transferase [Gymnopus androsaceus JB14]